MSLSSPILIERPAAIRFGCGLVREVGAYARAQGCQRILVVADAFNAGRVDLLDLAKLAAVLPGSGQGIHELAVQSRHMLAEMAVVDRPYATPLPAGGRRWRVPPEARAGQRRTCVP